MAFRLSFLVTGAALAAAATSASAGLVFNISYTAAVTGNANFAAIQTDVNLVAAKFSSLYSDNVTLNFTIDASPGGLGSSLFSPAFFRGSYAQVRTALAGDSKSADDATAVASLPGAAPIGPGANQWFLTSANAKAVGLVAANNAASDGTYTFTSDLNTFDFDPSNGITAGEYDFIGTTEHEFSELMGRTNQLDNPGFGYTAFDLFRFTAPGTRDFTGGAGQSCGVYYSINSGATNEKGYNCTDPGNADNQDWDSSVPSDPFNAFGTPGVVNALSNTGIQVMDVIGWDRASANSVPEPGSAALTLLAGGLLWRQRRRKSA